MNFLWVETVTCTKIFLPGTYTNPKYICQINEQVDQRSSEFSYVFCLWAEPVSDLETPRPTDRGK